ncbi:hypothetical protein HMPREF0262_02652 [Clostridium sp. ATCC 29733]|nr:hypothetical protein HMPREF0262_02652 [Clostridium sp. ATCC 29733]
MPFISKIALLVAFFVPFPLGKPGAKGLWPSPERGRQNRNQKQPAIRAGCWTGCRCGKANGLPFTSPPPTGG